MPAPFKLIAANINKLIDIGIKPASIKAVEAILISKKPADRTNLEESGLSTEEINDLMSATTSVEEEHVSEMKRAVIKVIGIEDKFGFLLILRYNLNQQNEGREKNLIVEEVCRINSNQAIFDYDNSIVPEDLKLLVKSPNGDFIRIKIGASEGLELELKKADLGKTTIEVLDKIKLITTTQKLVATSKLKGRILSKNSARKLEKIQIVIQVALMDKPQESDFFSVCYAVTEQDGYFFTSQIEIVFADLMKIKSARALVGVANVKPQNIRLIEQDIDGNKINSLPEKVILFLEDEDAKHKNEEEECDCGCKELDFHDKKGLEEFSFYSVVRTTEPLIEAYEISDVKKIDLKDIVADKELKGVLGGYFLPPFTINNFVAKNGAITKQNVANLLNIAKLQQQIDKIKIASRVKDPKFQSGRIDLDGNSEVDWDDKPTIYQATSIAHGHLLHFKQEWFNDGYTIGDLLYSLPLAPGQKKQIVVFDWDRKDSASNSQQLDYQENLYNSLSRDRDVNEVAKATLSENMEAASESSASGWGVGGGIGAAIPIPAGPAIIPLGALIGAGGGSGGANSSAKQRASRTSAAQSQQHINDRTVQSANAIRSQRATVIQTVAQGERFQVSAEVIANYNHCHAMTIQYFEVLRHFEIRTRLADVQECLFIPLKLSPFNRKKALRWRDTLMKCLKKRFLLPGFSALERYDDAVENCGEGNRQCIDKHYDDLGIPNNSYAEERLQYLEGELYLEFQIKMPEVVTDIDQMFQSGSTWEHFNGLIGGGLRSLFENEVKNENKQNEAFAKYIGPKVADSIINNLQFYAVKNGLDNNSKLLPIDASLLSNFKNRTKLNVSLRMKGSFDGTLKREDIDFVKIAFDQTVTASLKDSLDKLISGDYVRIIVHSGSMRYRTQSLHEYLFRDARIKNDLRINDEVHIFTPLSERALKRPRLEDIELSNALLHHLNEHIEYYHQCIWLKMDAQRRFMLLDGLVAPGKGKGRSVASVVENRLIGIVGNCLVMPVAAGFQLDPTLDDSIDLFEHYYENPKDPLHISLPTKGVFAEAVMGKCNSCEKKDESRFWRWEESPIPDSPTTINPLALPTPQNIQPSNFQPKDFPAPIINLQNGPVIPDPQGFGSLVNLLSNPNLFRDITGLTENQKNALAALQASFGTAQFFGGKAADLTNTAASLAPLTAKLQSLDQIKKAKENGLLSQEQAQKLTGQAFDAIINTTDNKAKSDSINKIKAIDDLLKDGVFPDEKSKQKANEIKGKLLESLAGLEEKNKSKEIDNFINKAANTPNSELIAESENERIIVKRGPLLASTDDTFIPTSTKIFELEIPKSILVNKKTTFVAKAEKEGVFNWEAEDGNPKAGTEQTFETMFDSVGLKVVKATFISAADAQKTVEPFTVNVNELSGNKWPALATNLGFKDSDDVDDLDLDFKTNVENFRKALTDGGVTENKIVSTKRPAERAFLMHYAWRVAGLSEKISAKDVPSNSQIFIEWKHFDAAGNFSDTDSIKAADEMVTAFGISRNNTVAPAPNSNHILGKALDLVISWVGKIKIKDANGNDVEIDTAKSPKDNKDVINHNLNDDLIKVGNSYGLFKLTDPKKDPNHWSFNGK